jgi:hypothetical protein
MVRRRCKWNLQTRQSGTPSATRVSTHAKASPLKPAPKLVQASRQKKSPEGLRSTAASSTSRVDGYTATRAPLKGRRDRVVLATKVNGRMGDGPNDRGQSRSHIISGCEASLRRLDTDWIDLYQVHSWDGQTPLDETLSALDYLVRCGKVRYIGCSNYSAWHLMKALGVADRLNVQAFATQQINCRESFAAASRRDRHRRGARRLAGPGRPELAHAPRRRQLGSHRRTD